MSIQRTFAIAVGIALDDDSPTLSPGSLTALQHATSLAKRLQSQLLLVHSSDAGSDEPSDHPSHAAEELLEGLVQAATKDGLQASYRMSHGRAWLDLVTPILRGEANFLVVGKRRHPASDGRPIGTVAKELLRKCPSPVLVVAPHTPQDLQSVLVATDLRPVSQMATEYGAYLAMHYDAPLHLVHAYQLPTEIQFAHGRISDEEYHERVHAYEDGLRQTIATHLAGAKADVHVERNSPRRAILRHIENERADLLVMGTVSRTGIPGWIVGNTAERLLALVNCSVLAVKPPDFESPIKA